MPKIYQITENSWPSSCLTRAQFHAVEFGCISLGLNSMYWMTRGDWIPFAFFWRDETFNSPPFQISMNNNVCIEYRCLRFAIYHTQHCTLHCTIHILIVCIIHRVAGFETPTTDGRVCRRTAINVSNIMSIDLLLIAKNFKHF